MLGLFAGAPCPNSGEMVHGDDAGVGSAALDAPAAPGGAELWAQGSRAGLGQPRGHCLLWILCLCFAATPREGTAGSKLTSLVNFLYSFWPFIILRSGGFFCFIFKHS